MHATPAILLLLAVAGCAAADPFDRPGTWSLPPTGLNSNDTNLRTMLVNPSDAVAGTGESTTLGPEATRPVQALMTGHRAALPSVNASAIGASGQQQQQPGTGGGAGGVGTQ